MKKIPKEELVDDIKKVFISTGSTKQENYIANGKYSRAVVKRHFGSWNNMLKELGYELNMYKPGQYNEQDIIDNYNEIKDNIGRPLSAAEFRKYGKYSQPIIDRVFGSFSNMKRKLGEIVDARFVSTEEIKQDMIRLAEKYGTLSQEIIVEESIISYPTVISRFGNLENLCKEINCKSSTPRKSKLLIQCLTVLSDKLGSSYVLEKTFPWLINPATGKHLFIDIYYKDLRLAIEVDGAQHYKYGKNIRHSHTVEQSNIIRQRDNIKEKLLREHKIQLIRLTKSSSSYIEKKLLEVTNLQV